MILKILRQKKRKRHKALCELHSKHNHTIATTQCSKITKKQTQGFMQNMFAPSGCDLYKSPISSLCSQSLMGESVNAATDTVYCETVKHPSNRNSGEQRHRSSVAVTRKTTKQMNEIALACSEVAQKFAHVALHPAVEERALNLPFVSCAPSPNSCYRKSRHREMVRT